MRKQYLQSVRVRRYDPTPLLDCGLERVHKLIGFIFREVVSALAYALCNPVGGIGSTSTSNSNGTTSGNSTVTGGANPPSSAVFTGSAADVRGNQLGWIVLAMAGILGFVVSM